MKIKVLFTFIALWLCLGGVKVYAQTYIGTEAELCAFAAAVNNGSFGTGTAYLIADINLTQSWAPIGNATHKFQGHFEGLGHKITNLAINVNADNVGFFGYIDGGSVHDLGIEGTTVQGTRILSGENYVGGECVGGICGKLAKVDVEGYKQVGGLCGSSAGKMENCWHEGDVTTSATEQVCAGGLVGCCESGADLLRCYVINTKITVDGITGSNPTNSLFGQVVGEWQGEINVNKLNSCVFNSENVYVDKYGAIDAVLGSYHGSDTDKPTDESVKAATTNRMKTKRFWSGKLNVEGESYIMSGDTKNFYNPNWVFMLTNDDPGNPDDIYDADDPDNPADPDCSNYPQLNSFYSKDKPITFNFSSTKQWLTIVPNGNYAVPEGVEAYKVIGVTGSTAGGGAATLSRVYALYEGCPAMVYSTEGTSKMSSGIFKEAIFGVYLRDHWGNLSDTTWAVLHPMEETQLDKRLFKNAALKDDNWVAGSTTNQYYPIERLWDGSGTSAYTDSKYWFFASGESPLPMWLTIDLGVKARISRIATLPRIAYVIWQGAHPRDFEFWGSLDPTGQPQEGREHEFDDTWFCLGRFTQFKPSGYQEDGTVGTITAEDNDYFNAGNDFEMDPDLEPRANDPIRYLRVVIVDTFGSYELKLTSYSLQLGEVTPYGQVLETYR